MTDATKVLAYDETMKTVLYVDAATLSDTIKTIDDSMASLLIAGGATDSRELTSADTAATSPQTAVTSADTAATSADTAATTTPETAVTLDAAGDPVAEDGTAVAGVTLVPSDQIAAPAPANTDPSASTQTPTGASAPVLVGTGTVTTASDSTAEHAHGVLVELMAFAKYWGGLMGEEVERFANKAKGLIEAGKVKAEEDL